MENLIACTNNILKQVSILLVFLLPMQSFANGLSITNTSYNANLNELTFSVSWQNAWYVSSTPGIHTYDGVWIFVKYAPNGGEAWQHLSIKSATPGTADLSAHVHEYDYGIMLKPQKCLNLSSCNIGNQQVVLELAPIIGVNPDFKIFGIEMVFIPEEPFYLGDGTSPATYYTYPDTLDPYLVSSGNSIPVGNSPNELNKKFTTLNTDIPAAYPKGFRSFWSMKHKVTMQQYAEYLNTLSRTQQNARTYTDVSEDTISNYFVMANNAVPLGRRAIRCDQVPSSGPIHFYCDLNNNGIPNESNDGQTIIMNNLTYQDILAYLDWAALRPMSKMEYEKLSRGSVFPVSGEYAWGTSGYIDAGNVINNGQASETFDNIGADPVWPDFGGLDFDGARAGCAATATSDRVSSGASYYGVLDIHSGSLLYIGELTQNLLNVHYFITQGDGTLAIDGHQNAFDESLLTFSHTRSYVHQTISDGGHVTSAIRNSFLTIMGVLRLNP